MRWIFFLVGATFVFGSVLGSPAVTPAQTPPDRPYRVLVPVGAGSTDLSSVATPTPTQIASLPSPSPTLTITPSPLASPSPTSTASPGLEGCGPEKVANGSFEQGDARWVWVAAGNMMTTTQQLPFDASTSVKMGGQTWVGGQIFQDFYSPPCARQITVKAALHVKVPDGTTGNDFRDVSVTAYFQDGKDGKYPIIAQVQATILDPHEQWLVRTVSMPIKAEDAGRLVRVYLDYSAGSIPVTYHADALSVTFQTAETASP